MAAQKKLLVEIEGTDNDGQYGTKSFKLPSRDDWSTNLQTINKKISKKFQVEEEYGLEINGQSVRYDDPDGLVAIMKDVDIDQGELVFKIIDISQVNSGANQGRKIVVHYNDEEFVHYADQELSKLDDDFYDEMYDAIKSAFKIRGKMGKIYEDVSGKKLYCDDWDDLSELLDDKEEGEALDLYIEGKGDKKSMPKSKGPGFNKPTNVPSKRKKTKTPQKTTDEEKEDYSNNALYIWCKSNGLEKYFKKLLDDFEIMEPEELIELNVSQLADDLGLKYGSKSRFEKAVNALRSNETPAQPAVYSEGIPSAKDPTSSVQKDDDEKGDYLENDELYVWCKKIQITKYYEALKKQIESPSDFSEFTATDIDDLCKEIGIKFGWKSRFKKAIKDIQAQSNEEEKEEEEKQQIAIKPLKPKRNLRGIVLVPCTKMEYQAPKQSPSRRNSKSKKKQTGLMAGAASIIKTVTNSFFSWDTKKPEQLNTRKEKRQRLKAPKHRIIGTGNNKVIMIVGQTGAGKTTLINSMMNYIYGVEFDDPYRFRLIQEKPKDQGQAESQTDHVSTYEIKQANGWKIPYDLTIIDTPGFADTRGIEKDKQIVADIRYFFEKILDGIDGVCFVVKSTDNRLTGAQNYVFNNVLNLWAKDILDNIFVLLTFCDGKRPPVMDALNQHSTLKNCHIFRLNNSAYSEDPTNRNPNEDDSFDQMFWNMGSKCFENFFAKLNETRTKSINESRKVLKQREAIQVKIEGISNSVDDALSQQQNIANQERIIKEKQKEIDNNKQVWHDEEYKEWVKIDSTSKIITTCFKCPNATCHKGCSVKDKLYCCVMNDDKICNQCGCHASKHENRSYYYERQSFTKQVSNWDEYPSTQEKAEAAKLGLSKSDMLLRSLEKKKKDVETQVQMMIADILKYRNFLEQVALRPTLTTVGDYIDQLIQNEEDSPQRDNKKIKQLKRYKKQENYINEILKTGDKTKIENLYGIKATKK